MNLRKVRRLFGLLGPAFVAAVAYVDPGNFAANFGAGAQYGYALLWVLIVANLIAMLVQYTSAKVGIATGKSLATIVGERLPTWARVLYWAQAELVAIATDIAEIIGGAIALKLLLGIPLPIGGLITAAISIVLLMTYTRHSQKIFERTIIALLFVIPIGFIAGLILHPPNVMQALHGMIPSFPNHAAITLITAMIGATVMPHVIYLHATLSVHRYHKATNHNRTSLLRVIRTDVGLAMGLAGCINISMLLFAAVLPTTGAVESFDAIYAGIQGAAGAGIAMLFAIGLLASGLASTSVGAQAGASIMSDLLGKHIPLFWRRSITIIPALVLLLLGADPMWSLLISQIALSIGIPFALIPLLIISSSKQLMGELVNHWLTKACLAVAVIMIVVLNGMFLVSALFN